MGFQPYWCWGYETGVNEHRVAIGNAATYSRELYEPENRRDRGLIGMDLIRLGLERGETAREAVLVMTELAERYGLWGSAIPGSNDEDGSYDTSFIVADPNEAWVLELAGERWAAKHIESGTYAISNEPSITTEWDEGSDDLIDRAIGRGWWPESDRDELNFALAYGDDARNSRQVSHIRAMRSRQLLGDADKVGLVDLMRVLRDHYEGTFLGGPMFSADNPDFLSLCMHDSPAGFTWGDTASSTLVTLPRKGEGLAVWWGGLVTPCTGAFVPYSIDSGIPASLARVGEAGLSARDPVEALPDAYSQDSPWWEFYDLLDTVRRDFNRNAPIVREKFDELEKRWRQQVASALETGHEEAVLRLGELSARCLDEALGAAATLRVRLSGGTS